MFSDLDLLDVFVGGAYSLSDSESVALSEDRWARSSGSVRFRCLYLAVRVLFASLFMLRIHTEMVSFAVQKKETSVCVVVL